MDEPVTEVHEPVVRASAQDDVGSPPQVPPVRVEVKIPEDAFEFVDLADRQSEEELLQPFACRAMLPLWRLGSKSIRDSAMSAQNWSWVM
jgi:hypothetical protein